MSSLREELEKLANPTPQFADPEDEGDEDTRARVVDKSTESDHDDDDDYAASGSKLRQQNAPLLSELDRRYSGKRVTRKHLQPDESISATVDDTVAALDDMLHVSDSDSSGDDDDDSEDDNPEEDDDDVDSDEDEDLEMSAFLKQMQMKQSDVKGDEFSFTDDGDYSKYADSDDESTENSINSDSNDEAEEEDDEKDNTEVKGDSEVTKSSEQGGIKQFSTTSVDEEIEKGKAAQAQLGLWDSLLENRIKVQKLVAISNKLPQHNVWAAMIKVGGKECKLQVKQSQKAVKKLLDSLVQLQSLLLLQNPETASVLDDESKQNKLSPNGKNKTPRTTANKSDEEITSESENDEGVDKSTSSTLDNERLTSGLKRKLPIDDYPDFLSKRHEIFKIYRDDTIQKWYDKTRLSTGKMSSKAFNAFDQSALKQIEQILSDRERLIKRTQLKRSQYKVIGKEEKPDNAVKVNNDGQEIPENQVSGGRDQLKHYDEEIFDDDDFYHQLLRELIERKTSNITDPIAQSRQWLAIQKMRSKVRKIVDTRASKGRKIRYHVHSKLVNFMAAVDHTSWTDQSRDELYTSLFGGQYQSKEPESSIRPGDIVQTVDR